MKPSEKLFFRLVKEGCYSIDEEGNVWIEKPLNNNTKNFTRRKKSLYTVQGYLRLRYICKGKKHQILHHRIVYIHHYGDIPDGMRINHIDGKRSNNCLSNLELVSPSENMLHAYNVIKTVTSYGENNNRAKLTRRDVVNIYREYWAWKIPYKEIAEKYGISVEHVRNVCNLRTWKHVWRVDGKIAGEIGRESDMEQMEEMPPWAFWDRSGIEEREVCDM